MLAPTTFALVVNATQLTGSAPRDSADDLAVSGGNVAKLLEVCRCVLPKAVRDRGHCLLATKQLLDRLTCFGFC